MSDVTNLDLALSKFCRRSSDPAGEPARILEQYTAALRSEVLAQDGQAYTGELAVLRGLVATLNGLAQHGDLSDVQKLLREHTNMEAEAREGGSVPPLTVYRAAHDSIVMGLYGTREAARAHCEAEERRSWLNGAVLSFGWIPDDPDPPSPEELSVSDQGGEDVEAPEETPTGYVVTPLEVPFEYDAEADE